jgi:hypothetical protein
MFAVREKLPAISLAVLLANVAVGAWLLALPIPAETRPIAVSNPANPDAMPDLSSVEDLDAGRQKRFEARVESWRTKKRSQEPETPVP